MTVGMPSKTGAGTIDANADGYGKITYMSADEWKTDVTLAYTLNGESKTLTVSNTAQPEFMDFLWLDPQYLSGNSSTTNKVVSDSIRFSYGKNDRHTYDVSFTKIEMGWMKEVPLGGGGNTYEEVGSTRRQSGTAPEPLRSRDPQDRLQMGTTRSGHLITTTFSMSFRPRMQREPRISTSTIT